jgi:acetoin utilization deacetylase AcuC-like enzyme
MATKISFNLSPQMCEATQKAVKALPQLQRLAYLVLPDEFTLDHALAIHSQLKLCSVQTIKKMLSNKDLFDCSVHPTIHPKIKFYKKKKI